MNALLLFTPYFSCNYWCVTIVALTSLRCCPTLKRAFLTVWYTLSLILRPSLLKVEVKLCEYAIWAKRKSSSLLKVIPCHSVTEMLLTTLVCVEASFPANTLRRIFWDQQVKYNSLKEKRNNSNLYMYSELFHCTWQGEDFSRDPLEWYFSRQRHWGGSCDNPTAY